MSRVQKKVVDHTCSVKVFGVSCASWCVFELSTPCRVSVCRPNFFETSEISETDRAKPTGSGFFKRFVTVLAMSDGKTVSRSSLRGGAAFHPMRKNQAHVTAPDTRTILRELHGPTWMLWHISHVSTVIQAVLRTASSVRHLAMEV